MYLPNFNFFNFLEKIKKTVENTGGFDDESDIEDGHDSDKDPDYHKPIIVNGIYIFC